RFPHSLFESTTRKMADLCFSLERFNRGSGPKLRLLRKHSRLGRPAHFARNDSKSGCFSLDCRGWPGHANASHQGSVRARFCLWRHAHGAAASHNPDLVLVSAAFLRPPTGTPAVENGQAGALFFYEFHSKRRSVL